MTTRIGLDVGGTSVKLAAVLGPEGTQQVPGPLAKSPTFRFVSPKRSRTDDLNSIVISECRRSMGNPFQTALDLLHEFQMRVPESCGGLIGVTGSGSPHVAEALNLTPENKFRAIARGVLALYPQARTIFEMGGENAKYILLDEPRSRDGPESADTSCQSAGIVDYSMNSQCAAGTGSFIESRGRKRPGSGRSTG